LGEFFFRYNLRIPKITALIVRMSRFKLKSRLAHLAVPVPDRPGAVRPSVSKKGLARKLGLFDATMLVMCGIVGSGIFINPFVVAQQVHTPALILGAWIFGGIIGVGGAFIWAELAATLPEVGGQYAYLREAYHPAVAFLHSKRWTRTVSPSKSYRPWPESVREPVHIQQPSARLSTLRQKRASLTGVNHILSNSYVGVTLRLSTL